MGGREGGKLLPDWTSYELPIWHVRVSVKLHGGRRLASYLPSYFTNLGCVVHKARKLERIGT